MAPGRTGDVTADDGLERDDLGLADEHRAALERRLVFPHLERHRVDVRGDEVRRDDVPELLEPEERDLRQDLALVWHALQRRARATETVRVGDSRATVRGDEGA